MKIPPNAEKHCTSIDCPERISMCCGVRPSTRSDNFVCSFCGDEFIGRKCTAGEEWSECNSYLDGEHCNGTIKEWECYRRIVNQQNKNLINKAELNLINKAELKRKIKGMKINWHWANVDYYGKNIGVECSTCCEIKDNPESVHKCEVFNSALNDVIKLIQ